MFNNISNPLAGYRAFGRPVGRNACSWMSLHIGFIKGNIMWKTKRRNSEHSKHEKVIDLKHILPDSKLATTFTLKEQQKFLSNEGFCIVENQNGIMFFNYLSNA